MEVTVTEKPYLELVEGIMLVTSLRSMPTN